MADVNHVLDRSPDHALRPGVGAAADCHHARNCLEVRLDSAVGFALLEGCKVLGALLRRLLRIGFKHLADQLLVALFDLFNADVIAHKNLPE